MFFDELRTTTHAALEDRYNYSLYVGTKLVTLQYFEAAAASVQELPSQVYGKIVDFLGPHGPDGLLAFVIFVGVLAAIKIGIDPYLATIFGVTIYGLYIARRWGAERHAERMAETEIAKTELELQRYRESQLLKIERAKVKALSPPKAGKGDKT
ncbi:hypothetical protein ACVIIV_005344 [Bradyrhizobium sp. USDA 4354]